MTATAKAIRAGLVTFSGDPFVAGVEAVRHYESDALVVMQEGRIADCGAAADVAARWPVDLDVTCYAESLITAGFIDTHVHYPQLPVIGAGGKALLDWLSGYTFPAEARYADDAYAAAVAGTYLQENLRNGITSAAVFCTVHPGSVNALFTQAEALGMRLIAGKVLMDRNAPEALLDTAQRGHDESAQLIALWHGKGRLGYALTPRFAVTSTPAQLDAAGALKRAHPDVHVQSHVSENVAEVALVQSLFPRARSYLDVYAGHGLTGARTIYGHGVHLSEDDFVFLHATDTAIAHCPTSNNFLGSGHFHLRTAMDARRPVRVGLATDLGGGTTFSILRTMQAAYEVAQHLQAPLPPACALYLATRGAARALDLDDCIGSVAVGMEADLAILDLVSTPLVAFRGRYAQDIDEMIALQMALAGERAVRATYVAGRCLYDRDTA